jgi:hypothetical protein
VQERGNRIDKALVHTKSHISRTRQRAAEAARCLNPPYDEEEREVLEQPAGAPDVRSLMLGGCYVVGPGSGRAVGVEATPEGREPSLLGTGSVWGVSTCVRAGVRASVGRLWCSRVVESA